MADNEKPQWELVAEAVLALGGHASRHQVWEYLKRSHRDIPFSTVTAELNSVSVNSPARTSYNAGREPRRTDSGNRYDRLFKVASGAGAHYVPYDPKAHGVWEIYPDPAATSTHKTSIRRVEGANTAVTVKLTEGAIKSGNTFFPVKAFEGDFFPPSLIRGKNPDAPAAKARFTTDAGIEFQSDIYRSSINSGYLHNRAAANDYYAARGAKGGDVLRYERTGDGSYHITLLPAETGTSSVDPQNPAMQSETTMMLPINKILFGPPGTGKTYRTVDEALRILDPIFFAAHSGSRDALKKRFDQLAEAGRIRFVTFHQSFSYEDFVEGIRADADADEGDEKAGGIRYRIEPGVFKQICEAARSRTVVESGAGSGIDVAGRRIWKISLGDANTEGHIYDECMDKGVALLGFGAGADLSGVTSRADILDRLRAAGARVYSTDYPVTALDLFVRRVKVGDLIVVSQGNLKFRAIGEVTGAYVHVDRDGVDTYAQGRPVRWLRRYEPARPYTDLMDNRFSQMTIYEPGTIKRERLAALLAPEQAESTDPEPRVLIIDEINRGNVSRIFGELITLIEPSKREGCDEALKVTLPYSKDDFSVPRNLHIIGTMNTADRSLAGLDVALRRRFEFTEMLPDIEALRKVVVADVPVGALLSKMNRRIELLLGRDYMLGHAYFMGLKDTPTIEALAQIFRRQLLPLLQEYFFEDWQKIAWVFNDHRKHDDALKFLKQDGAGMVELFGDLELPRDGRLWLVNAKAFANPNAYLATIEAPQPAKAAQATA